MKGRSRFFETVANVDESVLGCQGFFKGGQAQPQHAADHTQYCCDQTARSTTLHTHWWFESLYNPHLLLLKLLFINRDHVQVSHYSHYWFRYSQWGESSPKIRRCKWNVFLFLTAHSDLELKHEETSTRQLFVWGGEHRNGGVAEVCLLIYLFWP